MKHSYIFETDELTTIKTNMGIMQGDIRARFRETLDESHHGRPEVITQVHTGRRGRPRVSIDPEFLRWAYAHRSTTAISRFLNVNRDTVRNALLEYGIAQPQENPFSPPVSETESETPILEEDDLLDPNLPVPQHLSDVSIESEATQGLSSNRAPILASSTGRLSSISDEELDDLTLRLRAHYRRAGISMLYGMLRRLGHRVSRERIRGSLMRIDPVQRVFQRIKIRRRVYSVAGPMALWHHDGQHGNNNYISSYTLSLTSSYFQGLIRWGIVIHGFIDGYSRLIVGLRASDNNYGETVLALFLDAANSYGVPSRIRGDHGVENILLAAWMDQFRPGRHGSYIWGRY